MIDTVRKLVPPEHILRLSYHKVWGISAAVRYRFPGKRMVVIGVTGTDGKTTVSTMIHRILIAAGIKVGLATTVEFAIGNDIQKNTTHKTTLGRFGLQRTLKQMADAGCTHCVVETSSHALSQSRTWGIPYDIAVITNISPEHLDYHGNMENYKKTKGKLFESLMKSKSTAGVPKTSIVNFDHKETYNFFSQYPAELSLTYGQSEGARVQAQNIELQSDSSQFDITFHDKDVGDVAVRLPIPGDFNVSNALAAASVGYALRIDPHTIKHGLESLQPVPGRMERVDLGQDFDVLIDFAMTPVAYENVITSARKTTQNNLWMVFGACGDRDRKKRPIIGEIAGKLCDRVVLTDDEPYTEDPKKIIEEIEVGVKKSGKQKDTDYFVIPDRKEAIEFAIMNAEAGDTIIVPGMGDFEGRTFADGVIPWSEREVVKELLRKRLDQEKVLQEK